MIYNRLIVSVKHMVTFGIIFKLFICNTVILIKNIGKICNDLFYKHIRSNKIYY